MCRRLSTQLRPGSESLKADASPVTVADFAAQAVRGCSRPRRGAYRTAPARAHSSDGAHLHQNTKLIAIELGAAGGPTATAGAWPLVAEEDAAALRLEGASGLREAVCDAVREALGRPALTEASSGGPRLWLTL